MGKPVKNNGAGSFLPSARASVVAAPKTAGAASIWCAGCAGWAGSVGRLSARADSTWVL